jgi:hypothetical protein
LICALGAGGVALGDNQVTVWYATGTYDVYQNPPQVVINSGGAFKIAATDDGGLGDILSITVNSNCPPGTINLYVAADPNNPGYDPNNLETWWGARKIGMVGFTSDPPPAGITFNLNELRVSKDLGRDTVAVSRVTNVGGAVLVPENVFRNFYVYDTLASGASFEAGYMDSASLHLLDPNVSHSGHINISSVGYGQKIDVAGSMIGDLQVGHAGCINCNLTGLVHVAGSARTILVHAENSWYGGVTG